MNQINYKGHDTTPQILREAHKVVESCINTMDSRALQELSGGYSNDTSKLIDVMVYEAFKVLNNHQSKADDNEILVLDHVNSAIEESLRIQNMNYFITSAFGDEVDINWHHLQWGDLASRYKLIALLASRDHGKSFWLMLYAIWMMYKYDKNNPIHRKKNKGKGYIFSHTDSKAIDMLGDIKEMILQNNILKDRLFSGGNKGWADSKIVTKNGCELRVQGFNGAARGFHPAWLVVDDGLKDDVLYSPTQREKTTDKFKSVIYQMLVPDGQMIVMGTPFHREDMYSIFRTPEYDDWKYREYPAVYPDGTILWTGRYDYERLKERRKKLGNVIFSREFLVRPISSESSLFPWQVLKKSIHGMEGYTLVNNIEAFPIKFKAIVTGHDFAKSANVGADYTVYTAWGIDDQMNYWLLYMWRKLGASFDEQISKLKSIYANFAPNVMVVETVNFQTIYAEFLKDTDLPIVPHSTGTEKHQSEHGIPGMSVLFERGKFKLPYGDEYSKNCADLLLDEFNNITFADKGIQSVAGHDDIVMSTWFGRLGGLIIDQGLFSYEFI